MVKLVYNHGEQLAFVYVGTIIDMGVVILRAKQLRRIHLALAAMERSYLPADRLVVIL